MIFSGFYSMVLDSYTDYIDLIGDIYTPLEINLCGYSLTYLNTYFNGNNEEQTDEGELKKIDSEKAALEFIIEKVDITKFKTFIGDTNGNCIKLKEFYGGNGTFPTYNSGRYLVPGKYNETQKEIITRLKKKEHLFTFLERRHENITMLKVVIFFLCICLQVPHGKKIFRFIQFDKNKVYTAGGADGGD